MSPASYLLLLIYGLLLVGLAALNGGLLTLAIPLLVYIGFSLWYTPAAPPQLSLKRTASRTAVTEGEQLPITVTIRNEGHDLAELYLRERLPKGLIIHAGETRLLTSLAAGEVCQLQYTVTVERGTFEMPATAVVSYDPFALFASQTSHPATTDLIVLPHYPQLRSLPLRPSRTIGFSGPIPARQSGSGTNFWGVREYQPGDSLRRLNWQATARHHEALFTTEFEQERTAHISLILDTRSEQLLTFGGESLLTYAIRATAGLAASLLKDGHRVGLLLYGYGMDGVQPGYGHRQRARILRKLAEAKPTHSQVFRSFKYLPTRLFPAGTHLIFISPLTAGDETMFFRLRAHGYGVLIVSPNPVEFENRLLPHIFPPAEQPPEPIAHLAHRLATIERENFLRQLRQAGILTIDWPVQTSLDEQLQMTLRRSVPPAETRKKSL